MRENLILLVDADADSVGDVLEAAAHTGHAVRLVKTSRDAFKILHDAIDQIEVAIVDVDPGAHGLALLEAITGREERPAVIVLTALEETYMKPIAAQHGAAACLSKPISVAQLKSTVNQLPRVAARKRTPSSDAWGHPSERRPALREKALASPRKKLNLKVSKLAPPSSRSDERLPATKGTRRPRYFKKPKKSKLERKKLTHKYRKLTARPFPERRKTNKFRESHAGE
jgi:DNA-binding NtrC family response regulator